MEGLYSFRGRGHVGTLRYCDAAIGYESACMLAIEFVLCGAGECDIALLIPGGSACYVLTTILLGILLDTSTAYVLEFHDEGELLLVDTCGVVDVTV